MVDTQLTSATEDLTDIVTDFDVVSILTGTVGLGTGLFAAEFAASLVSGMLEGQSSTVRFIAEVGTKAVLATGTIFGARMFMSSGIGFVLLGMAGVGIAVSAVLQVIEAIADTGSSIVRGDISSSMPSGGVDGIDIEQNFSPQADGGSGSTATAGGDYR